MKKENGAGGWTPVFPPLFFFFFFPAVGFFNCPCFFLVISFLNFFFKFGRWREKKKKEKKKRKNAPFSKKIEKFGGKKGIKTIWGGGVFFWPLGFFFISWGGKRKDKFFWGVKPFFFMPFFFFPFPPLGFSKKF